MLDDWVRGAVGAGGYPALGGLVFAENLVPPIPSEIILPLAGFYVEQGLLAFLPALLAATLGSVTGALVLYAIGRFGGRAALLRWGARVGLTRQRLDRADVWFDRHGPWVVLTGRLVPGVRSLVSLPAGASQMPLGRFTLLTALGSAAWNAALIGAGWALGASWEQAAGVVSTATEVVVGLLLLAALALAARWAVRARTR